MRELYRQKNPEVSKLEVTAVTGRPFQHLAMERTARNGKMEVMINERIALHIVGQSQKNSARSCKSHDSKFTSAAVKYSVFSHCHSKRLSLRQPCSFGLSISMGQTTSQAAQPVKALASGCPVPHDKPAAAAASTGPAKCPIDHHKAVDTKPAQCPIDHTALSPLNQMPTLSQAPAEGQAVALPLERTESSIPRDPSSKWEYPSPQQFYNALVRKGWETPEEHVVTMVEIHNFLNEEAWEEVKKWERRSGR